MDTGGVRAACGKATSRPRPLRLPPLVVCLCVGFAGGCASWYAADADREVAVLLARYQARVLEGRESWVQQPAPPAVVPDSQPATSTSAPTSEFAEEMEFDLNTALRVAFESSPDLLDRREALYLAGLGFSLTRYNFGPILDSTIAYLWSDAEESIGSDSLSADLSARQILPLGGEVSGSAGVSGARTNDPQPFDGKQNFVYSSAVQVNLRQPLLRGAGYEASHEQLTQGERDLIYAVRDFELFREDFSIRVASVFYGLVSQKVRLANDEQNYLDAVYDRNKAEALRQVDRNEDDDVFLARRREIEAEDALLVSRTDYELALDEFKILLGLPTSTRIQIRDEEPAFETVRVDPQSAVAVAHYNRLDLHTEEDRVEDAERRLRIARNGLLPDLDLTGDYTLASGTNVGDDATPGRWSASMGLALGLPVDRKAERNAYRSALISLGRVRRDYEQRLDEVERDVLNQIRELHQIEKRIELQRDQVEFERRAVAVTRFRYEAGDVDNRDLLDARQGLTNAQNALINLKVQHFIARLRLHRNLGVLFIDEDGMWHE